MAAPVSQELCNERHKSLDNCLNLEKAKVASHDEMIKNVQEAIVVLTAIQARHDNEIEDHEGRLRGIESISGKRWNTAVTRIIEVSIVVTIGCLMGKIF
jgi:hypothetical protein